MRRIHPTSSGMASPGHRDHNYSHPNNSMSTLNAIIEPITPPASPSLLDEPVLVVDISSESETTLQPVDGSATVANCPTLSSLQVDVALPILYGGKLPQTKMTVAKAVSIFNKFWIQTKDWPTSASTPMKNLALPWLSESLFNQYLSQMGAVGLWESQHKCDSKTDQHRVSVKRALSRMARSKRWNGQFLTIYLSQYSMQAKTLAYEVYELGLAHQISQSLVVDSFEKRVYTLLGRYHTHGQSACNILPNISSLEQNDILYQHVDYVLFYEGTLAKSTLNTLIPYSKKTMYFSKLECGLTCLRKHRYAEAWAHFLSALDFCQPGFPLQSRLLDWLAELACILHLPMPVCYYALRQSSQAVKAFDENWHRWQVFHHMCCILGLFDLAEEVYLMHVEFPLDCTFSYWFKRQHLEGMMLHIEDNLVFQYARFTFHQKCSETCERPFNFSYSLPNVSKMVADLEPLVVSLKSAKEKDFYWGLIFFYKSMVAAGFLGNYLDTQAEHYLILARTFFSAAGESLGDGVHYSDARQIMAMHMSLLLEPQFFRLKNVKTDFDNQTLMPFSLDKANCLFRVTLFTLYWQLKFPTFKVKLLLAETIRAYSGVSNSHYRLNLLKSLLRTMDTEHRHKMDTSEDFPNPQAIFKTPQLGLIDRMTAAWQKEIKLFSGPPQTRRPRVLSNSRDFFKDAPSAEKYFALGYHTVEQRTVP